MVLPSTVPAPVSGHEDDDEYGVERGRTLQRYSTEVPYDYSDPPRAICEAVRRRVVVAPQRSPVRVLSKGAYKDALPTMIPEDVKDGIATAAKAGAFALLFTEAAKREVNRVLSKQYKPSDKELANGMVREAKVTGL